MSLDEILVSVVRCDDGDAHCGGAQRLRQRQYQASHTPRLHLISTVYSCLHTYKEFSFRFKDYYTDSLTRLVSGQTGAYDHYHDVLYA